MKDQIEGSQNPVVQRASQAADLVVNETSCARAIREMQKYDPEFDLEELTYESQEIFQEFFCNYLTGNQEYLDMVCGQTALAVVKSSVQLREKEGWRYKYEELLNCGSSFFMGGQISEKVPQFTYHIEC